MHLDMTKYEQKEQWFNSPKDWWYFTPKKTAAADFYRDIFPVGSFEEEIGYQKIYPKTNKGNGFVVYQEKDKYKTRMIFDDLNLDFMDYQTAFMSPIAYFGRNRTAANARELYALVFDVDEVGAEQLDIFFSYYFCSYEKAVFCGNRERLPMPTYVVNSGGGIHLYYVFEKPIPMYPNIQKELKKMKYELTERLWNGDTSELRTKQFQGINQGFRLVGGQTKRGEEVTAYRVGKKVTLDYLNKYVSEENRIQDTFYHSQLTLEEAKIKYPEWYHQRIELGRQRKNWTCKRDLYDWWKRQKEGIELHHRYFFVMCLTVYAVKCGIDFEELKKDAYSFQEDLDRISPENPFTKYDVDSALEMYQECYRSFPRDEISKLSGVPIPKNKRNGRTQSAHLVRARAMRDINQAEQGTKWNGRKSVEKTVYTYLEMNPKATYKQFVEDTGMQKSVFYKYKKLWEKERKIRAVSSIFDNCVKDANTGEPLNLIELITEIPVSSSQSE